MQIVINKCNKHLTLEKIWGQSRLVVFEKNTKTHTLILKNDDTEPKATLL